MFFDPFVQKRVPNYQHPKEQVKCWKCGLRFIKYHREPPYGDGLCKYCEAATKRSERHGMV